MKRLGFQCGVLLAGVALTAVLASCDPGGVRPAPAEGPITATTVPVLQATCETRDGTDVALCACVAQRAGDFNANQRGLLIASLAGNDAESGRFRSALRPAELADTGFFLALAIPECAAQAAAGQVDEE